MKKILFAMVIVMALGIFGCSGGEMGTIAPVDSPGALETPLPSPEEQQVKKETEEQYECLGASPPPQEITETKMSDINRMTEVLNCSDMNNLAVAFRLDKILAGPIFQDLFTKPSFINYIDGFTKETGITIDDIMSIFKDTTIGFCSDSINALLFGSEQFNPIFMIKGFSPTNLKEFGDRFDNLLVNFFNYTKTDYSIPDVSSDVICKDYRNRSTVDMVICTKGNDVYMSYITFNRPTRGLENLTETLKGEKVMIKIPNAELAWNEVIGNADIKALYRISKIDESATDLLMKVASPKSFYAVAAIASQEMRIEFKALFDNTVVASLLSYFDASKLNLVNIYYYLMSDKLLISGLAWNSEPTKIYQFGKIAIPLNKEDALLINLNDSYYKKIVNIEVSYVDANSSRQTVLVEATTPLQIPNAFTAYGYTYQIYIRYLDIFGAEQVTQPILINFDLPKLEITGVAWKGQPDRIFVPNETITPPTNPDDTLLLLLNTDYYAKLIQGLVIWNQTGQVNNVAGSMPEFAKAYIYSATSKLYSIAIQYNDGYGLLQNTNTVEIKFTSPYSPPPQTPPEP